MPLKTIVKVGHITNLSDARYCAGMGVELLGFDVIAGSNHFIEQQKFQEIRGWVSGPSVVANISGVQEKDALLPIIENYAPDYLELTVEEIMLLGDDLTQLPLILRIAEDAFLKRESVINSIRNKIAYLVLDQADSSAEFIKEVSEKFPVLLTPTEDSDINVVIEAIAIKGLSLSGSHELKPGLKDYDHLSNILEILEID